MKDEWASNSEIRCISLEYMPKNGIGGSWGKTFVLGLKKKKYNCTLISIVAAPLCTPVVRK